MDANLIPYLAMLGIPPGIISQIAGGQGGQQPAMPQVTVGHQPQLAQQAQAIGPDSIVPNYALPYWMQPQQPQQQQEGQQMNAGGVNAYSPDYGGMPSGQGTVSEGAGSGFLNGGGGGGIMGMI